MQRLLKMFAGIICSLDLVFGSTASVLAQTNSGADVLYDTTSRAAVTLSFSSN